VLQSLGSRSSPKQSLPMQTR